MILHTARDGVSTVPDVGPPTEFWGLPNLPLHFDSPRVYKREDKRFMILLLLILFTFFLYLQNCLGVGKSCLLLQFTDKRFQPVHDLTIGVTVAYDVKQSMKIVIIISTYFEPT